MAGVGNLKGGGKKTNQKKRGKKLYCDSKYHVATDEGTGGSQYLIPVRESESELQIRKMKLCLLN